MQDILLQCDFISVPFPGSFSPKSQPNAASIISNVAKVYTPKRTSLPRSHCGSSGRGLTSPTPAVANESEKETVREKTEPEGVAPSDADRRRGLSALVMRCFGKPLDKSQQLSDWERRPLRLEQVKYAGKGTFMPITQTFVFCNCSVRRSAVVFT